VVGTTAELAHITADAFADDVGACSGRRRRIQRHNMDTIQHTITHGTKVPKYHGLLGEEGGELDWSRVDGREKNIMGFKS
jgi:hypothetical protein